MNNQINTILGGITIPKHSYRFLIKEFQSRSSRWIANRKAKTRDLLSKYLHWAESVAEKLFSKTAIRNPIWFDYIGIFARFKLLTNILFNHRVPCLFSFRLYNFLLFFLVWFLKHFQEWDLIRMNIKCTHTHKRSQKMLQIPNEHALYRNRFSIATVTIIGKHMAHVK